MQYIKGILIACIYAPLYALERIKDQQMVMEVSIFVYVSNLVILFLLLQECCKEGLQRASTKPTASERIKKMCLPLILTPGKTHCYNSF